MADLDLKPYLRTLRRARIRWAPPWPREAFTYMEQHACKLAGWYGGHDSRNRALVWIELPATPADFVLVASEEIVHHTENDLPEGAAKARAVGLAADPTWAMAVRDRLIVLLQESVIRAKK